MFPFGSFSYTSSTQVPALLVILVFLVCNCTCKQVVIRLKIPQGLSTLLFHRWSEVPSRGGVRGDSPYENYLLYKDATCHLSVFSECRFLELLARPSSIRTLILIGFVVLFSVLFISEWFPLGSFLIWMLHFRAFTLAIISPAILLLSGFALFSIS